jgi:glycosyltransferase involved in cell wall biosynthesis
MTISKILPKIDVILPFHRIDQYLFLALNSLVLSKNVNLRVIIVDDRINKKEVFRLPQNFFEFSFKLINTEGLGQARAIELALSYVEAEFVGFMDSDDITHPKRLARQISMMQNHNLDVTYCALKQIDQNGKEFFFQAPIPIPQRDYRKQLLIGPFGANSSWVIRFSALKRLRPTDSLFKARDWAMAINNFGELRVGMLRERLYHYRQHDLQITNSPTYIENYWAELYPVWNEMNKSYGLPSLNEADSRSLTVPRYAISNDSRVLLKWQESFTLSIKSECRLTYNSYLSVLNFRNLQRNLSTNESTGLFRLSTYLYLVLFLKYQVLTETHWWISKLKERIFT